MKTSLVRLTQTLNNPLAPSVFQHNKFSHNSFSVSKVKDTAMELLSVLNGWDSAEQWDFIHHCNDE